MMRVTWNDRERWCQGDDNYLEKMAAAKFSEGELLKHKDSENQQSF